MEEWCRSEIEKLGRELTGMKDVVMVLEKGMESDKVSSEQILSCMVLLSERLAQMGEEVFQLVEQSEQEQK